MLLSGLVFDVQGCARWYWAVLGCTRLYWTLLSCTGLDWAGLGCTAQYWAVLDGNRLYWAVLDCTGWYSTVLGTGQCWVKGLLGPLMITWHLCLYINVRNKRCNACDTRTDN